MNRHQQKPGRAGSCDADTRISRVHGSNELMALLGLVPLGRAGLALGQKNQWAGNPSAVKQTFLNF